MDLVEAKARGFVASARHPWELARLALATRLIARHVALRPGDVVLDVGCGDSFVAESLAKQYPDVNFYAVDSAFTPDLIAMFEQRLTAPNVSLFASLESVPPDVSASLVLLMDVLEHVEDDHGMLRELTAHACVTSRTSMLITVPAYAGLFCSHDRFLGHYRRYSSHTFRALMTASGLAPVASGRLFASLVPVRLLQVIGERLSPPAEESPTGLATWQGGDWLARRLAWLLEWDGRAALTLLRVGVSIPGLSNFAICRPSA